MPRTTEEYDRRIYWRVKDGDIRPISSLMDSHLYNIVSYCRRKHMPISSYIYIVKEIKFRCALNNQKVPEEIANIPENDGRD